MAGEGLAVITDDNVHDCHAVAVLHCKIISSLCDRAERGLSVSVPASAILTAALCHAGGCRCCLRVGAISLGQGNYVGTIQGWALFDVWVLFL